MKLSGIKYLGPISDGETRTAYYSKSSGSYRSYGFEAKGGDEISVDVTSEDGDSMGWITSTSNTVYAANDDASPKTLDAKVVYKVPAGSASRQYRIVFRDYDRLAATFNVTLHVTSSTPEPPPTCSYGGKTYDVGATFKSTDGCNDCSCGTDGNATCGTKACVCDPDKEPNRNYIGTPASCGSIRYTCRTGTHSFKNDCGCGCEQN
ncbi:hypothetical protein AKJ09_02065 [Labilithrix luteola]|uniref:Uncharacterized protein n=1 Tax=Labilithrix luteola TaxID=1391654 RepID=A0A0K1PPU3_9BACT|nr:hypothetical protein AKJ09_02065 [Labilithrix luteola]